MAKNDTPGTTQTLLVPLLRIWAHVSDINVSIIFHVEITCKLVLVIKYEVSYADSISIIPIENANFFLILLGHIDIPV